MANPLTEEEIRTALRCIDVFQAIQKDIRTPGWYREEVRGKEAIGSATDALMRKGLIHPAGGAPPFRLTKKGQEFLGAQSKEWQTFMPKLERPGAVEKFAKALSRVAEQDT
jgi:hypothetical protein